MSAFIGFAPFVAFALLERFTGMAASLAVAALVSIALMSCSWRESRGEISVLEACSALMFSGLAIYALCDPNSSAWSIWLVRLCVDSGLCLAVLLSVVTMRPFTLQHSRRMVSDETAISAKFVRANCVLSSAWGLAFAALVAADLLMVILPATPSAMAIGLSLAALAGAVKFTQWFTFRVRAGAV